MTLELTRTGFAHAMTAPDTITDLTRLRVLLVDDNAALRGALRVSLNAFGCARVIETDTVDRALDVIASKTIDLVITDWKMTPRDGLDFVRTLRTAFDGPAAAIPVLMLSAYSDRARIAEASRAGVDAFLVKPFTAASLAGALGDTLTRKSGHAETGHAILSPAN